MQQEIRGAEWLTSEQSRRSGGKEQNYAIFLAKSGEIKTARVGRALRISRASLLTYMERCADDVQHP